MTEQAPQTQILYAIGKACLTVDALCASLGQPPSRVSRSLLGLIQRGLIERKEAGCFAATREGRGLMRQKAEVPRGAFATDKKARAAVRGTLRQRAWNAMRCRINFTIRDIAMLAARQMTEGRSVEQSLHKWVRALEQTGYLERLPQRQAGEAASSNGYLRYKLVRNTGLVAPVHSVQHDCVRDINMGKDFPCPK